MTWDTPTQVVNNIGVTGNDGTHTIGSGLKRCVWMIICGSGAGVTVSGTPTFGGQSMTLKSGFPFNSTPVFGNIYVYELKNPTPGSNSWSVAYTGSAFPDVYIISRDEVNQTTPTDAADTDTNNNHVSSSSATTTSENGDQVLDIIQTGGGPAGTTLVGNTTNNVTTTGLTNGVATFLTTGYVAAASGQVDSALVKVRDFADQTTSRVKILVWNSVGTLIAISEPAIVPISSVPDYVVATFKTPFSITSGQTYFLGVIPNSGQVDWFVGGATFQCSDATGTYSYNDPSGAVVSGASASASAAPTVYLMRAPATVSGSGQVILAKQISLSASNGHFSGLSYMPGGASVTQTWDLSGMSGDLGINHLQININTDSSPQQTFNPARTYRPRPYAPGSIR